MGLSADEIDDFKEAFFLLDTEKAGALKKEQMGTALRSLGMNPTEGEGLSPFPLPAPPHDCLVLCLVAEVTEIYGAVGGADTITEAQLIQAAEMMQGKMAGDQKAALLEVMLHSPVAAQYHSLDHLAMVSTHRSVVLASHPSRIWRNSDLCPLPR